MRIVYGVTAAAMSVFAATASGCDGGLIHKKSTLGGNEILSIDARQRLVVEGHEPISGHPVYCAEPSPDAIAAQAASLASALQSTGAPLTEEQKGEQRQINAALATGYSEAVQSIGLRTQSIQLMRDGYYRLCEALMNGQIGPDEYGDIVANIDGFILSMLAIEQLGDKAFAARNAGAAASVNLNVDATKGTVEAQPNAAAVSGEGAPAHISITNTDKAQAGDVAKHKSQAIVQVVERYFNWKKEYSKLRAESKKESMIYNPGHDRTHFYYTSGVKHSQPVVVMAPDYSSDP